MADAWTKGHDFVDALCAHLKQLDAAVQELRERVKRLEAEPAIAPLPSINDLPKDDGEWKRKLDEMIRRLDTPPPPNPFYPPPSYPQPFYPLPSYPQPYWAPIWTCGELKADNRPIWNASSP